MSLDARIRAALERSSTDVAPDVRRELATVRRRGRRAVIMHRIVYPLVAAAVIAVLALLVPSVLDSVRSQHLHRQPGTGPSPPVSSPTGSFRVDLSGIGGSMAASGLDGLWVMTISENGSIEWTPPARVASGEAHPGAIAEGLPRDTYTISGARFVTDLFRQDLCAGKGVGAYGWIRSGSTLAFTLVDDACAERAAILTSRPWTVQ